ncbi:leucine-rich repeat domain-containing protein [Herpetosiphon sp. NSE202]|uniref:leucine-rich repeat domain-containing protein n=1 Tax=Herpetosiphon sp. NSE202 TaxID=3351349 RepID=UPI0036385A25
MNEQLCRARIAHNAQTRKPTLDLSYLNLTSLPETIGELTHLEVLDLSRNPLQELPDELAKLTNLRSLDLSFFNLDTIPDWLDQLTGLEALDIRANPTTGIPAVLTRLPHLQKLNLYLDGFEALPRELLNLPTLHMLDIDGLEKLTTFPAWLSELPIKHLVYYPRGIANEHVIGTMTTLEALDLWHNHDELTAFPEWLRQMHHLRWLCFSANAVVPTWLMELSQLTYLESYSDFGKLSQIWHAWESLEQLKCRNVGDTAFPPNLKTLDLGINQATFPESIRTLRYLEELHIEGEGFRALPGWVLELPNLHTLDIRNTQIDHVHSPDKPNNSLRKLWMNSYSCSYNHTWDGLRSLHMLEELWLSNHTLGQLPAWLHELQQLRELSIDSCRLTNLDPRLGQLQQLEELYLHGNDIPIASLERILPTLTKLKHLSFGLSSDEPFPASIRELSQLRSLYLRIGPNHVIPEWLNQLTKLESIMLGYNIQPTQLRWIEGWLELPKLRQIDIHIEPELFDPELLQRFTQRGVEVDLG